MSDLVGKKKIVVDSNSYFTLPYSEENSPGPGQELVESAIPTVNGAKYLTSQNSTAADAISLSSQDNLRVALGKHWSLQGDALQESFTNSNARPKIFFKSPLDLQYCNDNEVEQVNGVQPLDDKLISTREKIVISCDLGNSAVSKLQNFDITPNVQLFGYLLKTGINSDKGIFQPIVNPMVEYYDHYHEAASPFSKQELLTKSPVLGAGYFSDVSTYYNERLNSSYFESVIGTRPLVQNSIPSLYSFLRLVNNKELTKNDYFTLQELIDYFNTYYDTNNMATIQQITTIYEDLLTMYPFEVAATMFGILGKAGTNTEEIIENLILFNKDSDKSGLYEKYFNGTGNSAGFAKLIAEDPKFNIPEDINVLTAIEGIAEHLLALERMLSNIIFSPNVIPIMDKVEKYKKYFPYYCELQFKATLNTKIGDFMKKTLMTRFFSQKIASGFDKPQHIVPSGLLGVVHGNGLFDNDVNFPYAQGKDHRVGQFVDYYKDTVYEDALNLQPKYSAGSLVTTNNEKLILDVVQVFEGPAGSKGQFGYLNEENYMLAGDELISDPTDINTYTSFLRDDLVEPAILDNDKNQVWKKILGNMFYSSILQTYQEKKRTFKDIMDGKPAYTEDLFYRIKKLRKNFDEVEYKMVQNVLIPNTSDLDIVKYIDTQLKYSDHAYYKYEVYTERIVFGSKYHYQWSDEKGDVIPALGSVSFGPATDGENLYEYVPGNFDAQGFALTIDDFLAGMKTDPEKNVTIDMQGIGQQIVPTMYEASCHVRVDPSIKIVEDLLFTTPEILIMDKPPVPPHVNIVPYRAINNRVRIMLQGSVDRFRDFPIVFSEEEQQDVDLIKKAQLSVDGKIEFGSDDATTSFQIFRSKAEPKSYYDFEPHPETPVLTTVAFDDKILPNTKYWYTFRAVDAHGHVSNPSEIYQVELIDEKGAVKPNIKLYTIKVVEDKEPAKSAQKYIKIEPSVRQLYFSEDSDTDSIFSTQQKKKRYKMRLTSKASGKKIDINFSFHKKQVDLET